jgi:N-acetylglutamate synthase/N-acetylornithine aminotransferase
VNESGEEVCLDRAEISLHSSVGKIFLFEDGRAKKFLAENAQKVLNGNDAELRIFLGNGNYCAQAYGRACR